MTLKEIAKLTGVSISTVSRVINHKDTKAASKEVQDKIWKIVRETEYVPNSNARNLKFKEQEEMSAMTKKTIGCIFARSHDTVNDPFFSQISRAIEQEAFRQGYFVKYSFSAYDINDPNTYQLISNNHVNGIVILGRFDKYLLSFVKNRYKHVVYTGLNQIDTNYDQVICDGYQAAMKAVHYLHQSGHVQIAYVGEKNNEVRYQGYCDAIRELGLPLRRENILITPFSSEGGYLGVQKFLEKPLEVTAFFCGNDSTAIGALKAVKEHGLKVPKDISFIGIDDIETAQYVSPMLTTIHIPMEELGKMAAKILIDRMEYGKSLPVKVELPFSLTIRESCRKVSSLQTNTTERN